MEKRLIMAWKVVAAFALMLGLCAVIGSAVDVPEKMIEIKGVARKCLFCHSYDKMREATAKYKFSSGETVTPHQYIPHKAPKNIANIPDCTECHQEHPIPLEDKSKVVLPKDVTFCYTTCHHLNNLAACGTCH
jgi:hypothetical protein